MNKFFFILFFVVRFVCLAQVTQVPDTNLRNFLKLNFSSYVTSSGEIIDTLAFKYSGQINCSSKKIASLEGIQKFKNIKSLNCSYNSLKDLDQIQNFDSLTSVFAHSNQIGNMPNLDRLKKLKTIRFSNNLIANSVDFTNNTELVTIQIESNKITSISGMSKLSKLQNLLVLDNLLTSLPDLSFLSSLTFLECHGNELDTIVGLDKLPNFKKLVAGSNKFKKVPFVEKLKSLETLGLWYNQIEELPSLDSLVNLVYFDVIGNRLISLPGFNNQKRLKTIKCNENQLVALPDLKKLDSLKILQCDRNLISNLPDLSAQLPTLQELSISNNNLDSLIDFSRFSMLKTLKVANNNLLFEDIAKVLSTKSDSLNVTYAPQNVLKIQDSVKVFEKQTYQYSPSSKLSLNSNRYSWEKSALSFSNTQNLIVNNVQFSDSGTYRLAISNIDVPDLIIYTSELVVKVLPCINIEKLKYNVTHKSCTQAAVLSVDTSSLQSFYKDYVFAIANVSKTFIQTSNYGYFTDLIENEYIVDVSSSKSNCTNQFKISIPITEINCNKGIILLNSTDTQRTLFYIDGESNANVYDYTGKIVNTFPTPKYWDGRNNKGEILPGLYIVSSGSKTYEVTVIE